jgi:heme-degrading monooxygenase HmoA
LFGRFSVADAMFAPVAFRFRTYDVPVTEPYAQAYLETMLALPAMKEWETASEAEVAERRAQPSTTTPPDPTSAEHCYAVILSSQRRRHLDDAYGRDAAAMVELASRQPGFLGVESARNPDGFGITISYWDSLEAIRTWKDVPEHAEVQARGRESFYERYEVRVANVERGYKFPS